MSAAAIPVVDPRVRHVGVSKLRELNATELRKQSERMETWVIQDKDQPLAVVLNYQLYLALQRAFISANPTAFEAAMS